MLCCVPVQTTEFSSNVGTIVCVYTHIEYMLCCVTVQTTQFSFNVGTIVYLLVVYIYITVYLYYNRSVNISDTFN